MEDALQWLRKIRAQFDSDPFAFMRQRINNLKSVEGGWFERATKDNGAEAADARLAQWLERNQLWAFASSVPSILDGMIALAEVDAELAAIIPPGGTAFSEISMKSGAALVWNPSGYDVCHADVWGPNGTLEFKAATAGKAKHNGQPQLGLIFSPKVNCGAEHDATFSVRCLCIGADGDVENDTFRLEIPAGDFVRYALGVLAPSEMGTRMVSRGGERDKGIGFPGGFDYVAKHIGTLGTYLSEVAQKVA